MTGLSQVFVHDGEDGHANHGHGDSDLQDLERYSEQQQCTQTRTNDGENDRGQQSTAAKDALPNERQGAANTHEGQSQYVGCNRDVGFNAQGDHHRNGNERRAAGHDADHARKEEHYD